MTLDHKIVWENAGREIGLRGAFWGKILGVVTSHPRYGLLNIIGFNKKIENALKNPAGFFEEALRELGIKYELSGEGSQMFSEQHPPRDDSPLLIAANHPYGIIDFLILGALLEKLKREFKIFVDTDPKNIFPDLGRSLDNRLILFTLASGSEASREGLRSLLQARKNLEQGVNIAIFPAVHRSRPLGLSGDVKDDRWHDGIAYMMLSKTDGLKFLPVYFEKKNDKLTQVIYLLAQHWTDKLNPLGHVLTNFLTLLETIKSKTIHVHVGKSCGRDDLCTDATDSKGTKLRTTLTSAMRNRTDSLRPQSARIRRTARILTS